jgi:hypothetical protein
MASLVVQSLLAHNLIGRVEHVKSAEGL